MYARTAQVRVQQDDPLARLGEDDSQVDATVVLPSPGMALVTRIARTGASTLAKPRLVRSVRNASEAGARGFDRVAKPL